MLDITRPFADSVTLLEPSAVVGLFHEVRKVLDDIAEGVEGHRIDSLDLQGLDEALGLGIVIGVSRLPIEPASP